MMHRPGRDLHRRNMQLSEPVILLYQNKPLYMEMDSVKSV